VTSTEGNTMAALIAYAAIITGLLAFLGVRWVVDRWVAAGDKVEALADLSTPTVDEHAAQAIAATQEPRLRNWHTHPCGCWCGSDGRKRLCPTDAVKVQEIRDLLTWERERHEP
jgi:hypothetical protein